MRALKGVERTLYAGDRPCLPSSSGSLEQLRKLTCRSDDDNAWRHLGYIALYDWCWGGDAQWLIAQSEDGAYYSHDHGWFLPPTGREWTESELVAQLARPDEFADEGDGIDREHVARMVDRLKTLRRDEISTALVPIPTSWPVTDEQLETVGYFLEARAAGVAARLESRFGAQR